MKMIHLHILSLLLIIQKLSNYLKIERRMNIIDSTYNIHPSFFIFYLKQEKANKNIRNL